MYLEVKGPNEFTYRRQEPPPPRARRGYVLALLVAAILWIGSQTPVGAQVTSSGGRVVITAWDGTNIINVGDNANSAIRVNVVAGSAGGPTHVDDAAFTAGTDDGIPAFGFFDDTSPDSVNENDAGALRMSANRVLYGTIRDAAGNERGVNVTAANQLETSVTAALPAGTNNIGDVDVLTLPAIPAGTNNIGDVDIATLPVASSANNDGAQVSVTTTSGTVLASFSTRKYASVCSAPTNTDIIYLKLGATATTSDYPLYIGQCFNISNAMPYTGVIDGRSAAGTQTATIVEW